MKRGLKVFVSLLLVAVIAIPSILATELGTSSKTVKVGTVDTIDNYDVDIEWGNMIFNFVEKKDNKGDSYYVWEPESDGTGDTVNSGYIKVDNYSTTIVNLDISFESSMVNVSGTIEGNIVNETLTLLDTEPDDWGESLEIYCKDENSNRFIKVEDNVSFEPEKYYIILGTGENNFEGIIPGMQFLYDTDAIHSAYIGNLTLIDGNIENVTEGATIGTVTVTLS